jgi:hypothetical protein
MRTSGIEWEPFRGEEARMKYLAVLLVLSAFAMAKDTVQVEVKAVHSATREARDTRAIMEKGIMGSGSPGRTVEVFNLDAIIGNEHVVLACDDDKGCEAPALGTYSGDMKRRGHMKLTFDLPVTHKSVSRWYKIAGSW